MSGAIHKTFRDLGLAESRYSTPEDIEFRRQTASEIRKIADYNDSDWILSGYEEIRKKRQRLRRQADRYETCGLKYTVVRCKSCHIPLIGPMRCESRICESCSRKYAARVRKNQYEHLKHFRRSRGKWFMHLILTLKVHELYRPQTADVKRSGKCLRKLINKLWPRKQGCGAFAVLEVGKRHNLHYHVLIYGYYIPQKAISDLWLKLTGDSRVVYITAARSPKRCVNYLLKYITKPPIKKNPKAMAEYLDMICGIRRIRTYGIFYNWPLTRKCSVPCPLCSGKLQFSGFDEGHRIPFDALFFGEALRVAKGKVN